MEDKIKPLAIEIVNKRNQINNTNDQMRSIKNANFLDIIELSKDKETAKELNLTNEKGRTLELDNRLAADPEYMRYDAVQKQLSSELELMLIELEHERNAFKVWYVENLKIANGV